MGEIPKGDYDKMYGSGPVSWESIRVQEKEEYGGCDYSGDQIRRHL